MADCIIKNDDGLILLNDGTSCILLNEQVPGVEIIGTHATQLIAPRAGRLDFVEFTFLIKAGIIFQIRSQSKLISVLIREAISHLKLKSSLLIGINFPYKIKSTLIAEAKQTKIYLESYVIKQISDSFILSSNTINEKLKKVFLRKLLEDIDKDDG